MRPRKVVMLQKVLAAEHAVVYGYGVAGARLRGTARRRARRTWDRHRASRDLVALLITEQGVDPAAAAATYALPRPVETAADARLFAMLLEERLAAVWADAVHALDGDLRAMAVDGLRDAAVAAALWRSGSVPFPGLAERQP